jgi:hypothetical protein
MTTVCILSSVHIALDNRISYRGAPGLLRYSMSYPSRQGGIQGG